MLWLALLLSRWMAHGGRASMGGCPLCGRRANNITVRFHSFESLHFKVGASNPRITARPNPAMALFVRSTWGLGPASPRIEVREYLSTGYGLRFSTETYWNPCEQTGENGFPRKPTGSLFRSYRNLPKSPSTSGNSRENVCIYIYIYIYIYTYV